MDRRTFLVSAAAAATGAAGCLAASAPGNCFPSVPNEGFQILNRDNEAHTIAVEVIQELVVYSPTIHEETYELAPLGESGNAVTVENVVQKAGHHVIRARLVDGASTTHLWRVTRDRCDGVTIAILDDRISIGKPE